MTEGVVQHDGDDEGMWVDGVREVESRSLACSMM